MGEQLRQEGGQDSLGAHRPVPLQPPVISAWTELWPTQNSQVGFLTPVPQKVTMLERGPYHGTGKQGH